MPISKVTIVFITTETGTLVEFKMFYFSEKKMENIIEMGFEQDITAVHEQLKMLFQEKNSGIHNRKSIISIDLRAARVRDCGGILYFFL